MKFGEENIICQKIIRPNLQLQKKIGANRIQTEMLHCIELADSDEQEK